MTTGAPRFRLSRYSLNAAGWRVLATIIALTAGFDHRAINGAVGPRSQAISKKTWPSHCVRNRLNMRHEPVARQIQQAYRDHQHRKSGVSGKRVSVRVDLGGRRIIQKKKK